MSDKTGTQPGDVTELLQRYSSGDKSTLNQVIPIIYAELKRLASIQLRKSSLRNSLDTTLLVHEAFEKLVTGKTQQFNDRRHFFAISARAMRQIVIDTYRSQTSAKRGGENLVEFEIQAGDVIDAANPERVTLFGQAMESLAEHDESLVELLDMSCFAGLSNDEISELTGNSLRTVQRKLARAKAWITTLIEQQQGD